ncbi:MAG: hypothetical protein QG665_455 [Patescibacteria group bacterium]|nr:hypothetical protein [Patescibacteria group bacterium]
MGVQLVDGSGGLGLSWGQKGGLMENPAPQKVGDTDKCQCPCHYPPADPTREWRDRYDSCRCCPTGGVCISRPQ